MGSPLHIAPLPDIFFIKLAHGHFLSDGVNPIIKVFCICLISHAENIPGVSGRDFVRGTKLP